MKFVKQHTCVVGSSLHVPTALRWDLKARPGEPCLPVYVWYTSSSCRPGSHSWRSSCILWPRTAD